MICTRHGFDPARVLNANDRLETLAQDGVLEIVDGVVRLCGEHRFLARAAAAAAAFDAYLAKSPRAHGKAA